MADAIVASNKHAMRYLAEPRLVPLDHPQADGLTERCVQTMKAALRKFAFTHVQSGSSAAIPYTAAHNWVHIVRG